MSQDATKPAGRRAVLLANRFPMRLRIPYRVCGIYSTLPAARIPTVVWWAAITLAMLMTAAELEALQQAGAGLEQEQTAT
jgi:hypothetical protein